MTSRDKFVDIDAVLRDLQESISRLTEVDTTEIASKVASLRKELYQGMDRWSSVEVSRHPERPGADAYIGAIFSGFMELHGDRLYGDDPAVIGGPALLDGVPVMVIAHRKRSVHKRDYLNHHYGMASPAGHHKAIRLLKLAEKTARPVVTFVDTPGAYPVPEAEYQGQAFSIAQCLAVIASVSTPVVACIIGEAASGGALAFGFGDRIIMLENAFYSAISPEGFSSIKYGDATLKEDAAEVLRGTGRDLYEAGLVDHLVSEPMGGAHNDPAAVISETGRLIRECLRELGQLDIREMLRMRSRRIEGLVPLPR